MCVNLQLVEFEKMARVFALDEEHCDAALRSSLQNSLRVYDECVALPQAHKSVESGAFKNIVLNLNGAEKELNPDVFSINWFAGVSGIEIPVSQAEEILNDPVKKKSALKALAAAIPSEMAEKVVCIGPELECTKDDRDLQDWVCGFDSPGCCVGLYSASHSKSPDSTRCGISRPHNTYFLICKAGGGLAAQTFHSRLSASLKKGTTLDQALSEGGSPGAQSLRRVSMASQRNRGRILCLAAEALGFQNIDTIGDMGCCEQKACRVAVTNLNITTNSIQKNHQNGASVSYQYFAGAVDSQASQGILSCSNAAEGFLLFVDQEGNYKISTKNSACNAIPFCSVRIESNKDIVIKTAEDFKARRDKNSNIKNTHPDHKWIKERFAWNGRDFGVDIEPPPLLGTYTSETFSSVWSRELGLSRTRAIRLEPQLVCVAATETAKLRAAARHILGNVASRN